MKFCYSYCSHGGVCTLELGHDGLHDANGYCQWTDKEAISKKEADERFLLEAKFNGVESLASLILNIGDIANNKLNELDK